MNRQILEDLGRLVIDVEQKLFQILQKYLLDPALLDVFQVLIPEERKRSGVRPQPIPSCGTETLRITDPRKLQTILGWKEPNTPECCRLLLDRTGRSVHQYHPTGTGFHPYPIWVTGRVFNDSLLSFLSLGAINIPDPEGRKIIL